MRDEAERDRQSGLLRRLSSEGFEVRGDAPKCAKTFDSKTDAEN